MGSLVWTWDRKCAGAGPNGLALLENIDGFGEGLSGLRAAFSAAVVEAHYATDAAMADLRRDYPALFGANGKTLADDSPAAFTENEWLSAMGWRPDTGAFPSCFTAA